MGILLDVEIINYRTMKNPAGSAGLWLALISGHRTQNRLWLLSCGGEHGIQVWNRSPCPPVPQLLIGNVIELDLGGADALEYKKDILPIRTPACIAVTTFTGDGVDLFALPALAVIEIQVPKAIIADRVIEEE